MSSLIFCTLGANSSIPPPWNLYFIFCCLLYSPAFSTSAGVIQAPPLTSYGFCSCLPSQLFHMPPMALPPLSMFQDNREQTAGLESPAHSESDFSLLLEFITLKELSTGSSPLCFWGRFLSVERWRITKEWAFFSSDSFCSGLESKTLCVVQTVPEAGCCSWGSGRTGSRSWISHRSKEKVWW